MERDKLTNEEKIRVFALYLGCEVCYGEYNKHAGRLISVELPDSISTFNNVDYRQNWNIKHMKLELRTLSTITDEHAIEVAKILKSASHLTKESIIAQVKELLCTNKLWNGQTNISGASWWDVYQYLISKSYAVPLFFGINHPLNGKDPITLGIAINKTLNNG